MQGKRGGERAIIDYEEPMRRVRKKETEKGKRTSIEMMRGKERGSEREGGRYDKSERKSQRAIDGGGRARTQKQREREERGKARGRVRPP